MATKLRPPPPPKPPTSPAKLRQAALHESRHNPVDTTALNVGLNGLSGLNGTSDSNGNNNGAGAQPTINTSATSSQPPSLEHESVVMTPRGKTANSTVILIERKLIERIGDRQHVAGGDHAGIIINKDAADDRRSDQLAPQLSLEFRVFLVSGQTGDHSQESRTLRFWFRDWLTDGDRQAHVAQEFFRELVAPKEFPRDYVGFIKKIMKLMQRGYNEIQGLEVELRIMEKTSAPPSRPLSYDDQQFEVVPLTLEKILELIEQAYPNPITPEEIARDRGWAEEDVLQMMLSLQQRGIIKAMEFNSYTRIHHEDTEIKMVKQMPTIASNKQPTIAIVTAQYCEKLAVDAMLENKETFVRYTTVGTSPEKDVNGLQRRRQKQTRFGESNVYTLGNIGAHRIVSTKLPAVGSTRESMTAAGNTTTRLLGTFQKVDYVFILGVAGGVPHYTDYKRHVRLGDVVVSHVAAAAAAPATPSAAAAATASIGATTTASNEKPFVYVYSSGDERRTYHPVNDCLQTIARSLLASPDGQRPWDAYLADGLEHLQARTETDFRRPAAASDKLYMHIGNRDVIEVAHPQPSPSSPSISSAGGGVDGLMNGGGDAAVNRIHLGPIGANKDLERSDQARIEFAQRYGLLATDVEISSVLESIIGNCRESFVVVKGISDYKDGLSSRKWQNHAALAAAAVMKSIICGMDAPKNV